MKLKKSGIPKKNLDKNDDLVYSIYFIMQYNIELIFANISIIEYWFFSDV